MRAALPVLLAVLGAVLIASGVGLASLPAGLVTGGLECIAGAYVVGYLGARR